MSARHADLASLGLVEWLRIGDRAAVMSLLDDMRALGVRRLRTQFSWADWHTDEGQRWYAWLMPTLARHCEVLPCFCYTPPSLGLEPRTASPPRDSKAFADFLDQVIDRFGDCFEWVELWNEPNNLNDWDWHLDHDWHLFGAMIGQAAHWAHRRGKKTLLGGMCPTDPNWLALMAQRGVLQHIDAVGIHGFPGTWDFRDESWADRIASVRGVLDKHGLEPELWLTECGYSTWRHDEIEQVHRFLDVVRAPADRIYWYSARDLGAALSHQDGFHEDERHYHFGLRDDAGRAKLLFRLWADAGFEGIERIARVAGPRDAVLRRCPAPVDDAEAAIDKPAPIDTMAMVQPLRRATRPGPVLITGGAGFIGINLARRLLDDGHEVLIYDNLSRPGVERNLQWLAERHATGLHVAVADVRDRYLVREAVQRASRVFHLAAQVAVTSSLDDPRNDFDVNLGGTLNVLAGLRACRQPPPLLFTSTNKVYGALDDVALTVGNGGYVPTAARLRARGIDESRPLDFHSPYGCSKGGADQYVLDHARSFGLRTAVFRMSCIYGPHQQGNEDQGWVAHFLRSVLADEVIVLYGDGHQVRDVLFVDDLVDAMLRCQARIADLSGRAFNIGGGPTRAVSLRQVLGRIAQITGLQPKIEQGAWRTGDQRYYVSDISAFSSAAAWRPRVDVGTGLERLHGWLDGGADRAPPARAATHA